MDPENGPMSRVERTFWTFWNYITETVNRFLRPEPPVTEINETNATPDISINNEHLDTVDCAGQEDSVPVSSVSSRRPVIHWDVGSELQCESTQHTVAEEADETGIDVANLPTSASTTVENQEEGCFMKEIAETLIPTTLANSPNENVNEVKEYEQNSCALEVTGTKLKNIDLLKEIDMEQFLEYTVTVSESDIKPAEKEHCVEHKDGLQTYGIGLEKIEKVHTLEQSANDQSEENKEESELKKEEGETTENNDNDMTTKNTACGIEDEEQDNTVELCLETVNLEEAKLNSCTVEVAERADESNEEIIENDNDDLHKPLTSLVLETENMSEQDDATLFQKMSNSEHEEGKMQSDDTVVTQCIGGMEENQSWKFSETLADLSVSDNSDTCVQESERVEQPVKSEDDEKEIKAEEHDENRTAKTKTSFEVENEDHGEERALNVEKEIVCMTDDEKSDEEIKDMDSDDSYLPTSLVLNTEMLSVLNNQPVQNEHRKITDDCDIMKEGDPVAGEQKQHSAADRNERSANDGVEKSSKLDEVILEEEIRIAKENVKVKKIALKTVNEMQTPDLLADDFLVTCDHNDMEVSSEIDSSMGKRCVTVIHESMSTQEEGKAIKNIPPGECEGQESEQLYSCKESRGEVPGHNNEPNIESASQRFLEEGNCKENPTTLLQEEVESGAAECLQNSGSSEGADSFEVLMEIEDNNNKLEEHNIGPEQKTLADNVMKIVGTSTYKDFEVECILQKHEEEEDLKEAIEFEMGESLCEADTVAGAVQEIQPENVSGVTKNDFNANTFQDFTFSIKDQSPFETECEIETMERIFPKDTQEGLGTLDEEATTMISESYSEEAHLEAAVEDSTKVSHGEKLIDVADRQISTGPLTDENICQSFVEQVICRDVIEEEILDLWIKQTSADNSEVEGEDQGQGGSHLELPDGEKVESMPELSIAGDVNVSLSTIESGFFDQSLDMGGSHECKKQEIPKIEQLITTSSEEHKSEVGQNEFSSAEPLSEVFCTQEFLRKSLCITSESTEEEFDEWSTSHIFDATVSVYSPTASGNNTFTIQTEDEQVKQMRTLFEQEALVDIQPDSPNEIGNTMFMPDTPTEGCQLPFQEETKVDALSEPKGDKQTCEVDVSELDFTPQKSRIAVKNPRARPPKDPRSLLLKASLEQSPSKHQASSAPAGVPMGTLGLGVKLPGLGAGFPVLKKTKKIVEDETEIATEETPPVGDDDNLKSEDSPQRPKWTPPNHPSFGNPFMSELKSKLKKPAKE